MAIWKGDKPVGKHNTLALADIKDAHIVEEKGMDKSFRWCFAIHTNKKKIILAASAERDRLQWVRSLKAQRGGGESMNFYGIAGP